MEWPPSIWETSYPPKAAVAIVRDAAAGTLGVAFIARQLRDWTNNLPAPVGTSGRPTPEAAATGYGARGAPTTAPSDGAPGVRRGARRSVHGDLRAMRLSGETCSGHTR